MKDNKIGAKGVYACKKCAAVEIIPLPKRKRPPCTRCGGDVVYFRSRVEHKHWTYLLMREREGEIFNLQFEPKFECSINGKFIRTICFDAAFFEGNRHVIQDVKGYMNAAMQDGFNLKCALVEALYGVKIEVVK